MRFARIRGGLSHVSTPTHTPSRAYTQLSYHPIQKPFNPPPQTPPGSSSSPTPDRSPACSPQVTSHTHYRISLFPHSPKNTSGRHSGDQAGPAERPVSIPASSSPRTSPPSPPEILSSPADGQGSAHRFVPLSYLKHTSLPSSASYPSAFSPSTRKFSST